MDNVQKSDVKKIVDKLLNLQDRFFSEAQELYEEGEGRVSLLQVVGLDGDNLKLKVEGQKIVYANDADVPVHILKCSVDCFLDIVSGDLSLREAITKGYFVIESANNGTINLVECEKWARAFKAFNHIIGKVI